MKRKAFSLIELLMTVVVIGVLAAILTGVLSSVRQTSDNARCASNLRMVEAAAQRFFMDRDGAFLPTKHWEVYPSWGAVGKEGMRDYLGIETSLSNITRVPEFYRDSVATCPSMQALYPQIVSALHRTYAFNYYLNQYDQSSVHNDLPPGQRPELAGGYGKVGNVSRPSAMWMFTEGMPYVQDGYYATSISSSDSAGRMEFPHAGRQNFVFLDGHVEALSREAFVAQGKNNDFFGRSQ